MQNPPQPYGVQGRIINLDQSPATSAAQPQQDSNAAPG